MKPKIIITKKDQTIVQKVNSCLCLDRLARILSTHEWNRFIDIVESGRFTFSGDPTGFHIDSSQGVLDCASPETTLMLDTFKEPEVHQFLKTKVGVY